MRSVLRALRSFASGDPQAGQGLVEYVLIVVLIAIVAIIALIFVGGQVSTQLSTIGNQF